jgi:hypothetical protein
MRGMAKVSNAIGVKALAGHSRDIPGEATADALIADYGGDSRAAIVALLKVIHGLMRENQALGHAASPGFARRPPGDSVN